MKTIFIRAIYLLGLVACIISCSKKEIPVPDAGPAGLPGESRYGLPGTMTGRVLLIDSENMYQPNVNTVTVSLESTTISTTCNSAGSFTLVSVPPGIYNISYLGPNCGLIQQQQIVFAGNGNHFLERVTLYEKPSHEIKDAIINENDSMKGRFEFILAIPKLTNYRNCLILLSLDSALTIEDPKSYDFVDHFTLKTSSDFHFGLYHTKYPLGTKYFVRFYPYVYGTSAYYDVQGDRLRYTGYGLVLNKVLSVIAD